MSTQSELELYQIAMNEIDVRELSKDEKLKLLREVLEKYRNGYLCLKITSNALACGYITRDQYSETSGSYLAQKLIPEILQFEPAGTFFGGAWFAGVAHESDLDLTRKKVLEDLIELITNS
jgi:hypothetical protein